MKKKKQKTMMIAIAVILILALGGGVFYLYSQNKQLSQQKATLASTLNANSQTVYVATKDIKENETINADGDNANVELQPAYTGLETYNYITEDDLGKKAVIPIDSGVPVMCSMVTDAEITNDSREFEFGAIEVATTQEDYDVVDVRVIFPDGSDYIVIPKVTISNLRIEQSVFSGTINEEEILRYSCAVVDAYKSTGAKLYTTKYVASSLQEEAVPTYPVSDVTRELVQSDPNVVTQAEQTLNAAARLSLEDRLGAISEEQRESINQNMVNETGKRTSLITEKVNNDKQQESMEGADMTTDNTNTDTTTTDTSN